MSQKPNKTVEQALDVLLHANYCNKQCTTKDCIEMKKLLLHLKRCTEKHNAVCETCRQMLALIVQHSTTCNYSFCDIQFCSSIKKRFEKKMIEKTRANSSSNDQPSTSKNCQQQLTRSNSNRSSSESESNYPHEMNVDDFVFRMPEIPKFNYPVDSNVSGETSRDLNYRENYGAQNFFKKKFDILRRTNDVYFHNKNTISKKDFYKRTIKYYGDI
ncbi:hypothetical protein PVAND_005966 [Polypedilum vanderplanki]|uniref:histone acetyltransferase n=1 Tax=Polypedilum vanderplanki TaxID=319348 RepID=A0A9J6C2K4_POLVA|nr:hypothetical protein PVAND_005966 [Polypedilum vanderplanki]